MILYEMLKVTTKRVVRSNRIPKCVEVIHDNDKHYFRFDQIVATAAKFLGCRGITKKMNRSQRFAVIKEARDAAKDKIAGSAVSAWYLGTEKTPLDETVKVADLRDGYENVRGFGVSRLRHAANRTGSNSLTPSHLAAARDLCSAMDIIIVDTDVQAKNLELFLAKNGMLCCVASARSVEGYYTSNLATDWSQSFIAHD